MNAALLLETLGRTSLWLAGAAVAMALVLRVARLNWPTAHRAVWLAVLLVGWTILRLPVTVPWYETAKVEADVDLASAIAAPAYAVAADASDLQLPSEPAELPAAGPAAIEPPRAVEPAPMSSNFNWRVALAGGWAMGIAALLSIWMIGYARFLRLLASRVPAGEGHQAEWKALQAAAGVRQSIPLCVADELGPLLCRLPRGYELIVPEPLWRELDAGERLAILRHELAHYQRGDVWKSLAARVLALPHWFNPAVWLAVRRFEEAAEWACDRTAADHEPAIEYAKVLMRLGEATHSTAYGSAVRGRSLAMRIRRVLYLPREDSYMKKSAVIAAGLALVVASALELQLVARQPASQSEPSSRSAGTGPTVSPYLRLIQDQAPPVDAAPEVPAVAEEIEPKFNNDVLDLFKKPSARHVEASQAQTSAEKMLSEAREVFEANLAAYVARTASLQSVHDWSQRWMEAASAVAESQEQRVQAAQEHYKRMKGLKGQVEALAKLQVKGGEATYLRAANYYVAQAELRLAEFEGVPPGEAANARSNDRVAGDVQIVDLKIKIAEIQGQMAQTVIELEAAKTQYGLAQNLYQKNSISQSELTRLNADVQKKESQLQSLKEQRELHHQKLKLLTSTSDLAPNTFKKAAAKTPVEGAKPTEPLSLNVTPARYDGKDFASWAEELHNELSPERRTEAIKALAEFGAHGMGKQAAELILLTMRGYSAVPNENSPEGKLSVAAYNAFQRIPAKDSFPLLTRALKSDAENERLFAMAIVTNVSPSRDETQRLLMPMLKDPQAAVRRQAATYLLSNDPPPPEVGAQLRAWLASDDSNQVLFAVYGIIGAGRASNDNKSPGDRQLLTMLMPDLLGLLDRDEPVKSAVQKALGDLRPNALPALEEATKSNNATTRQRAEELLEQLRAKSDLRSKKSSPKDN